MTHTNDRKSQSGQAASIGAQVVAGGDKRSDLIADGSLVEVPKALAKEASFRVPVAFTPAAWAECVQSENGDREHEESRVYDVLFMALNAIRRKDRKTDRADFIVHRVKQGESVRTPVDLIIKVGPGDTAAPVLTILLGHED